ncbi:MAG: FxsA family protein [Devosia sp.]
MGRIVFLIFLSVPLIEIAFFVLIGQAIGLWPTLFGVLVTAIAGALVLRIQGMTLFTEIRETMGRGMLPARALADAMLVAIAGVLLLTPGYFTDLLGILLLIPPIRSGLYALLKSRMRVVSTAYTGYGWQAERRVQDGGTIDLDDEDWRRR